MVDGAENLKDPQSGTIYYYLVASFWASNLFDKQKFYCLSHGSWAYVKSNIAPTVLGFFY